MNKATMRQKSKNELEAIISESEALIKRTEEEIGWALFWELKTLVFGEKRLQL